MLRSPRHLRNAIAQRLLTRLFVTLAPLAALSGCFVSTYEWHQELEILLTGPGVPRGPERMFRSGSSTVRVDVRHTWGPLVPSEMRGGRTEVSGEATVVDVYPERFYPDGPPDGRPRYLFALVPWHEGVSSIFGPKGNIRANPSVRQMMRSVKATTGRIVIPPDMMPRMVAFRDIDDPASVFVVEPDDIPAVFGEGVAFRTAHVSITDGPATFGTVRAVLPWLSRYPEPFVVQDDRHPPSSPEAHLTHGYFVSNDR